MSVTSHPFGVDNTTSPRATRQVRPSAALPLLLPFLLLGGVICQSQDENRVIAGGALPGSIPASSSRRAPADKPKQASYVIYAPNADAKLVRTVVPARGYFLTDQNVATSRTPLQVALVTGALRKLLADYKAFFPPRTQLLEPVTLNGGYVHVNLNSAYAAESATWTRADVQNRVMSIVRTAAATKEPVSGSESSEVRIFIEGKPVQKLGTLDTSMPIEGWL